jgi:hypothetical protein
MDWLCTNEGKPIDSRSTQLLAEHKFNRPKVEWICHYERGLRVAVNELCAIIITDCNFIVTLIITILINMLR